MAVQFTPSVPTNSARLQIQADQIQAKVESSPLPKQDTYIVSNSAYKMFEKYSLDTSAFVSRAKQSVPGGEGGVLKHIWQEEIRSNTAMRQKLDGAAAGLLEENGITLPEGASFRIQCTAPDQLSVSGLDDPELSAAIERAFSQDGFSQALWTHLRACRSFNAVIYQDGHLLDVNTSFGFGEGQRDWQEAYLTDTRKASSYVADVLYDHTLQTEAGLSDPDGEFLKSDMSKYGPNVEKGLAGGTPLTGKVLYIPGSEGAEQTAKNYQELLGSLIAEKPEEP